MHTAGHINNAPDTQLWLQKKAKTKQISHLHDVVGQGDGGSHVGERVFQEGAGNDSAADLHAAVQCKVIALAM